VRYYWYMVTLSRCKVVVYVVVPSTQAAAGATQALQGRKAHASDILAGRGGRP